MRIHTLAALAAASLAAPAAAADYMGELQSEVFQAPGQTPAQLTATGKMCMAQHLAAGVQGGQTIVAEGPQSVVSNNVLIYRDGLMEWTMRSTVTFEVRDGRFRITHSRIERFAEGYGGWGPVGKWMGSGWKKAEGALLRVTDNLAACARAPAAKADEF